MSHTSTEITSVCYEAAKKSLQAHLHFFPAFSSTGDVEMLSSYVSWILLYASWTPLIVVFLHAIASASQEDVKLLEEAEKTLDLIKEVNQQSQQVYNLCRTFHKVARIFVEKNSTFVGTYNSLDDTVIMPQSDHMRDFGYVPTQQSQPYHMLAPSVDSAMIPSFDETDMNGISMFLGDWLGNNAPVSQLWSMDLSSNVG